MRGNIIPYLIMCQKEGTSLQRGMNFRLQGKHSVILMSVRPNAPYRDEIKEGGSVLIYEGHDEAKRNGLPYPKSLNQPEFNPSGSLTENGKFHKAAQGFKNGTKGPDIVQVYEKIKPGIWSDNGYFHLVDSWQEPDGTRTVFKFKLVAIENIDDASKPEDAPYRLAERSRIIPTSVKLEVWARDRGCCVTCGATDELHFDHIVPFSKGGTSLKAENINYCVPDTTCLKAQKSCNKRLTSLLKIQHVCTLTPQLSNHLLCIVRLTIGPKFNTGYLVATRT